VPKTNSNSKATNLKYLLNRTLQRILEPIARIAIRGEISHREFVESSKLAFFRVARDDYGVSGRKTNLARVAILTGLSRKECSRLKQLQDSYSQPVSEAMNPCTRVIAAWHQDPEYLDGEGRPLTIPAEGPAPSLEHLIKESAGDMPKGAIVKELERLQVIVLSEKDNMWQITRRNFIPQVFDRERVRIIGNQLSDLGSTINFNLANAETGDSRLERYVVHENVPVELIDEFQALATQRSQEILEELDLWLTEKTQAGTGENQPTNGTHLRTGLGVYFFKNDE